MDKKVIPLLKKIALEIALKYGITEEDLKDFLDNL